MCEHQRLATQRHLLECYLFLRGFHIEPSANSEYLRLTKRADSRNFSLKVDAGWLQVHSPATVEHRLDTLGLVSFLEKHGAARLGLTPTGQELVMNLEREPDVKPLR
jgi:hypothetical protein